MSKEKTTTPKSTMVGGPADSSLATNAKTDVPAEKEAKQEFSVEYEGRKLNLDEVRKELESYSEFKKTYGKQQNEIGAMRKELAEVKGFMSGVTAKPAEQANPYEEVADTFFEAPPKAFEKLESRIASKIKAEMESALNEVKGNVNAAIEAKNHWDKFYKTNPDLEPYRDDIVPYIANSLSTTIADLPADKALNIVAKEARRSIVELKKRMEGYGAEEVKVTGKQSERPGLQSEVVLESAKTPISRDAYNNKAIDIVKKARRFKTSYESI